MEEKYVQKLPSNQGQYDQIYTVMYISMQDRPQEHMSTVGYEKIDSSQWPSVQCMSMCIVWMSDEGVNPMDLLIYVGM